MNRQLLRCLVSLLLLLRTHGVRTTSNNNLALEIQTFHIAFVSLPIPHHFEPILALATALAKKGHYISIALPSTHEDWISSYDIPDSVQVVVTEAPPEDMTYSSWMNRIEQFKDREVPSTAIVWTQEELLQQAIVSNQDRAYNVGRRPWYSWLAAPFEFSALSNALSRKGLYGTLSKMLSFYNSYHLPMLKSLIQRYSTDKPDLFVIDRYTYAGFSAAHRLNVSYIVNSPGPLSDIDDPANHVPAPLSGNSMYRPSILGRCLNLIFRLRYRLATAKAYEEINQVRWLYGIPPVTTRQDIYGKSIVLANTMFGIDDARPMNPLIVLVGSLDAVVPSVTCNSAETSNQKNRRNTKTAKAVKTVKTVKSVKSTKSMKNTKNTKSTTSSSSSSSSSFSSSIVLDLSSRVPIPARVLEIILRSLSSLILQLNSTLTCIAPHPAERLSQYILKNKGVRQKENLNALYQIWCDQVLPPYHRTGQVPTSVAAADVVILSGDSAKTLRAVAYGKPMLLLPFFADQLDMAVRLERVGCGIMINPVAEEEVLRQELQGAVQAVVRQGPTRTKMLHSIRWLQGVLHSTGGIEEATHNIETIAMYGSASITPHKDGLVWYERFALDVGAVYVGALILIWLVAKLTNSILSLINLNFVEL